VGVSEEELCARYPLLWHMAEAGSWPSIEAHGLRSTSSLLDLYAVTGDERRRIERQHRTESVELRAPGLPLAVVRDQAPINEATLLRVLQDGLAPADWYLILNERVFFWLSERRLDKLLRAGRYRDRAHIVVIAETRLVLKHHSDHVTLSPMNSGNTMMTALPRGRDTFSPPSRYPFHERRRAGREPVVELAVTGMIDNVKAVAISVERRAPGNAPVVLWRRS
jgi:hypothetical protein